MRQNSLPALPQVSLGMAPLGGLYARLSDAQAYATVHAALAEGITCFDTAPRYGNGLSERRLGLALAGVPRAQYLLSSKVGHLITTEGNVVVDFSRDGILRSIDESLTRLQLDHLDIVHLHDPDNNEKAALDEAFPVLAELRAQGVIKAVGAGMNQWEMLDRFLSHADFDCFLLAGRYTLLEHSQSYAFLDRCAKRGVYILAGGVFNSGILATGTIMHAKYNYAEPPTAVIRRVQQIEEICTRYTVPLAAVALQFVQAHPAVASLVLGMDSPEQVRANLVFLRISLPPDLWHDLLSNGLIDARVPLPVDV